MDNQWSPPGKRITRLSFSIVTQRFDDGAGRYHIERRQYALGPNALEEDVANLWCEMGERYMTVTMVIAPRGSLTDLSRAGEDILKWAETTGPRRKVGKSKTSSAELEAIERAEGDDILLRMWNNAKSIEHRQVLYKMSEITGPVELSVYLPPIAKPDQIKPNA